MSEQRDDGSNFLRDLTDAASRTPLSAALIGMGTLWFVGERAWQGARPMMYQASEVVGSAASQIRSYRRTGQAYAADQPGLAELFRRQPFALGVLGVAIGAGLAAALPPTRMEGEVLGDSSDEFKAKASDFAEEQAHRAEEAAEK